MTNSETDPGAARPMLQRENIPAVVTEYDRIVRFNATTVDYDVIGEVIADDGLPTVADEIGETARDMGWSIHPDDDEMHDAITAAADTYKRRLAAERI